MTEHETPWAVCMLTEKHRIPACICPSDECLSCGFEENEHRRRIKLMEEKGLQEREDGLRGLIIDR